MATGKRYYWIKLKESFMTSDLIDHIMEQPHGAEYLIIYQLLCLKAINTDGRLELQVGGSRIPFSVDKLRRDFRWFNEKRIKEAILVLKEGQLIDIEADGTIVIKNFNELTGYESDYAVQKRRQRTVPRPSHSVSVDKSADIVRTEIDREIEKIKDKIFTT